MNAAYLFLILAIGVAGDTTTASGATEPDENDYGAFSDQVTKVCQVDGLWVRPPEGWISVPIDFGAKDSFAGCQMMLIENDEIIGILRFLSAQLPDGGDPQKMMIAMELPFIEAMNYSFGEALWRDDDVAVAGDGFEDGKGLGISLSRPGNPNPMEGHFLTFHGPDRHYIMTLVTFAESVNDGIDYGKSTAAMATAMRTMRPGTFD